MDREDSELERGESSRRMVEIKSQKASDAENAMLEVEIHANPDLNENQRKEM